MRLKTAAATAPALQVQTRPLQARLRAVAPKGALIYTLVLDNDSQFSLNGAQAVLHLPDGVTLSGSPDSVTQQGHDLVITLGRLAAGEERTLQLKTVVGDLRRGEVLVARATLRSSTALPAEGGEVRTHVRSRGSHDDDKGE